MGEVRGGGGEIDDARKEKKNLRLVPEEREICKIVKPTPLSDNTTKGG